MNGKGSATENTDNTEGYGIGYKGVKDWSFGEGP